MAPTATHSELVATTMPNKAATGAGSQSGAPSLDLVLRYEDLVGSGPSRQAFVAQLREAMVGLGFFYLRDSPLQDPRERLFALARSFLDRSYEEKDIISQLHSKRFRGWSTTGTEVTAHRPDNREQIDLAIEAPEFAAQAPDAEEYLNLWGPNPWPDHIVPELRGAVLEYMNKAEEVTVQITSAIEDALGVSQGRLNDMLGLQHKDQSFKKIQDLTSQWLSDPTSAPRTAEELESLLPDHMPYHRLKLVKYGREVNSQGVGAHRDTAWVTLLATDEQEGLQVQDLDGTWLGVPYRSGCVVVNFGQQLERVSSGLIRAATHRVQIGPSENGRVSIPFFSQPGLRTLVNPIPRSEISSEALALSASAQQQRVSEVPEGDMHGEADKVFGVVAWDVLKRSHPECYRRWYGKGAS